MKDIIIEKKALGIAAPQIGISKRFFVMRPGVLWWVCFNPVITESTGELVAQDEGCLSLPSVRKRVTRPSSITVEFFNEKWIKETYNLTGLNARVFQHELDHLNGVLISDV
jgi:peptide deformylase